MKNQKSPLGTSLVRNFNSANYNSKSNSLKALKIMYDIYCPAWLEGGSSISILLLVEGRGEQSFPVNENDTSLLIGNRILALAMFLNNLSLSSVVRTLEYFNEERRENYGIWLQKGFPSLPQTTNPDKWLAEFADLLDNDIGFIKEKLNSSMGTELANFKDTGYWTAWFPKPTG